MTARLFPVAAVCAALLAQAVGDSVRIGGAGAAVVPFKAAQFTLAEEHKIDVKILPELNSSTAMTMLAEKTLNVALTNRAVTGNEKAEYPNLLFQQDRIGTQALVLAVSKDVWDGGVRAITKEQMVALYEGETKNWKALGGPDLPVKFFNPERGRGVWELFATWLYGEIRRAPLGKQWEEVKTNGDAASSVEFNAGSISVVPLGRADGQRIFPLTIVDGGKSHEAKAAQYLDGTHPLARPLIMVTANKATGDVRRLLDYFLGPEGQKLVKEAEHIPLAAAK